jgi:hypothetical protein
MAEEDPRKVSTSLPPSPALDLSEVPPKRFEELVSDLLRAEGFENVQLRGAGADGGRDITASTFERDASGFREERRWFCDAKRYANGIGFEKIEPTLSKTTAHDVDYLLFAAWPSLTPPCKTELESWTRNHRPQFKIRHWEKTEIEALLLKHTDILKKYLPSAWNERLEVDAILRTSVDALRSLRTRVSVVWKNPDHRPFTDLLHLVPRRPQDRSAEAVDTIHTLSATERAFLVGLVDALEHLESLLMKSLNIAEPTAFLRGKWGGRPDVRLLLPVPLSHLLRPEMSDGVGRVLCLFEEHVEKGLAGGVLTGSSCWKPLKDRNCVAVYAFFPAEVEPGVEG